MMEIFLKLYQKIDYATKLNCESVINSQFAGKK